MNSSTRTSLRSLWSSIAVASLLAVTGCAWVGLDRPAQRQPLAPADFARAEPTDDAPPPPRTASTQAGDVTVTRDAPADPAPPTRTTTAPPTPTADAEPSAEALAVDGMVGQVNGEPIFARTVFEDLDAQLRARGAELPSSRFREEATQLVIDRLRTIVFDRLILGEAERDLSEREQMGLLNIIRRQREELIRDLGAGAEAVADERARQLKGRSLDEMVEQHRQSVVIQKFLQKKLYPRINVTRRDVERYYRDNYEMFNPPPGRLVRIIRAEARHEERIASLLEEGQPFEKVASDARLNKRPDNGGLWSEEPITGDEPFRFAAVNEALLALKEGEYAGPIDVMNEKWWIYLEELRTGEGQPLDGPVQLKIAAALRRQQYNDLVAEYRRELLREGSFTSLEQMASTLLEVAMARYASPSR